MAEVFILLGGNVGDKSKISEQARKLISERIGFIIKASSLYATESWGFESDLFWNQVIILDSKLDPFEILNKTQTIETEMGRTKKSTGYEPRVIDIDLLYYDNLIINTPRLTIPHPRIGERKFVLIPLNELNPQKKDPVSKLTVQELLNLCEDQLNVDLIG